MPQTAKESPSRRFEREGAAPDPSPPPKARRGRTEAFVDAQQLLDRLAEVISRSERAHVHLESEREKRERLEAALAKEHDLREKAERALAQAKSAGAALSAELKAERTAREQAESNLARVDGKASILEQQVNLSWSQLKANEEEEQRTPSRRWWGRGDG
jgi:hypothetical protein